MKRIADCTVMEVIDTCASIERGHKGCPFYNVEEKRCLAESFPENLEGCKVDEPPDMDRDCWDDLLDMRLEEVVSLCLNYPNCHECPLFIKEQKRCLFSGSPAIEWALSLNVDVF